MTTSRKSFICACACGLAAVSLTACAPGDIALEGKIFEVAGLAGTQQGGGRNVKMADRAPLIVPPDPNRLPVPGETGSTADADAVIASIDDPDRKRIKSKSDLEKAQAAYCKENYELAKARGDIATADSAVGPLGSCKPSIFSALKNWNATPDE